MSGNLTWVIVGNYRDDYGQWHNVYGPPPPPPPYYNQPYQQPYRYPPPPPFYPYGHPNGCPPPARYPPPFYGDPYGYPLPIQNGFAERNVQQLTLSTPEQSHQNSPSPPPSEPQADNNATVVAPVAIRPSPHLNGRKH